jgi:uncharacterized protein YcbK (DUF882 family)
VNAVRAVVGLAGALWLAGTAAAEPARFFVIGSGRLAIENAHTKERADVRYRREDGTYDAEALGTLNRLFRSRGDGEVTEVSLRLIEVLSHVQGLAGGTPVVLVSGYRSPEYNEAIRDRGAKAAGGSLHTEGLAADVAFPAPKLRPLWLEIRELDCCGAGYYAKSGFLHIDVGRPRFWEPATSRVDENLSAGNARLFARTQWDVYRPGETIEVRLHSLTVPPVRIAKTARLVAPGGESVAELRVEAELPEHDGCLEVAEPGTRLRMSGAGEGSAGRVVLRTCEPRGEKTPEAVEANRVAVR